MAMAVDCDAKPQHKQTNKHFNESIDSLSFILQNLSELIHFFKFDYIGYL